MKMKKVLCDIKPGVALLRWSSVIVFFVVRPIAAPPFRAATNVAVVGGYLFTQFTETDSPPPDPPCFFCVSVVLFAV